MTTSLEAKTQPNFFCPKKKRMQKKFSNDSCDLDFKNSRKVLNDSWKIKNSISSLDWFSYAFRNENFTRYLHKLVQQSDT